MAAIARHVVKDDAGLARDKRRWSATVAMGEDTVMGQQLNLPRSTSAAADLLEESIFSIGWNKRKKREMTE